ncbi:uncharacterized protein LOC141677273 [Apium graveolens]|uniref:uncharacterized protein LOC141677273 n=1 Tax=Apium graveolens TaxID=4045 RepID=UPI003D7C0A56
MTSSKIASGVNFIKQKKIYSLVGMLSIGQLSRGQMQMYINEENTKWRNLLQKYISLCNDAKVLVDTMLMESDTVAKTILDLIAVVNITNLVMGSRRPPSTSTHCLFSSIFKIGVGKAAYVQKNAPRYCDISIVYSDKKVNIDGKKQLTLMPVSSPPVSSNQKGISAQQQEINFPECVCFSGKFN